jgi:hypothetical protein
MLSFDISYPDLIKFSYFADTTEREDRGGGGETEGEFTDNSKRVLKNLPYSTNSRSHFD